MSYSPRDSGQDGDAGAALQQTPCPGLCPRLPLASCLPGAGHCTRGRHPQPHCQPLPPAGQRGQGAVPVSSQQGHYHYHYHHYDNHVITSQACSSHKIKSCPDPNCLHLLSLHECLASATVWCGYFKVRGSPSVLLIMSYLNSLDPGGHELHPPPLSLGARLVRPGQGQQGLVAGDAGLAEG